MNLSVSTMTRAEKLQAMEQLWVSLQHHHEDVSSLQWHGESLAERRKRIDSGATTFSTLDDVEERLRNRSS